MSWTYHQRTGELWRNGAKVATGYSGNGKGLNNPDMETVQGVGPIPRGRWYLDGVYNSAKVGPFAIILDPDPSTNTFGRSAFRIHGDNSKGDRSASNGCIILPRAIRDKLWNFKDRILDVVE